MIGKMQNSQRRRGGKGYHYFRRRLGDQVSLHFIDPEVQN